MSADVELPGNRLRGERRLHDSHPKVEEGIEVSVGEIPGDLRWVSFSGAVKHPADVEAAARLGSGLVWGAQLRRGEATREELE